MVSIVLAVLLFVDAISPVVGGLVFALALVFLGGTSRAFRR